MTPGRESDRDHYPPSPPCQSLAWLVSFGQFLTAVLTEQQLHTRHCAWQGPKAAPRTRSNCNLVADPLRGEGQVAFPTAEKGLEAQSCHCNPPSF